MEHCYYCNTEVNKLYNFCISCEKQIRCVKCNNWLVKDKSKCLVCGTSLIVDESQNAVMNTYSLEENYSRTSYWRKIEVAATTDAIGKIAPALGSINPYVGSNTLSHNPIMSSKQVNLPNEKRQLALPFTTDNSNELEEETIIADDNRDTKLKTVDSSNASVEQIFTVDSKGYLIAQTADFKGHSKKTQQERFTLLYIWAYNKLFNMPVPNKEHLTNASKLNGLYDKNFGTYISRISKYINNADKAYKLNPMGNQEVNKIIQDLNDENKKGFDLASQKKQNISYSKPKTEDDTKISEWILIPSRISALDIRNIDKNIHYCILAIYDITREIKSVEAITPSTAFNYFIKRYKNISITKKSFVRDLTHTRNEKYFSKREDGKYYTTKDADLVAEQIIQTLS